LSELDIEDFGALAEYLRTAAHVPAGERVSFQKLEGGVSNRTVLVRRSCGADWVLKQALSKLRVEVNWFSSPRRIEREGLGLRWLPLLTHAGATAQLVFEDRRHWLLAMEAVPPPHQNWKTLLLAGRIEKDHVREFGELLAEIHSNSYARRNELRAVFDDRSFFESLRLEPYYLYTSTEVAGHAGRFLRDLAAETRAHRLTLVHGDYSPKNILIHQDRMVLLDHEVIHFGDPAFDAGFALAHLLSKAHHLAPVRPEFAAGALEFWTTYVAGLHGAAFTEGIEPRSVRHTLGCLLARVAGKSQLEYLSEVEKRRQSQAVQLLMAAVPTSVPDLVLEFMEAVSG
jgi:5-methylthioribose kinase